MKILVTGGAGFIGSHLVDALLAAGHSVRVLDNLDAQVHGEGGVRPAYLSEEAELQVGDVRDRAAVAKALDGMEAVYHLAAAVGVGQSMYEIEHYVSVNSLGAAVVLEEIVKRREDLCKVIVASSMSLYGEGAYRDSSGEIQYPGIRPESQLEKRQWDFDDAKGVSLTPIPTPESKPPIPTSVYAVTKRDHEELFLSVGAAYQIPTVALRFFNVYGTRQALSNPYTGVVAIFSSRLLNRHAPLIFEDGNQSRDFIHVSDIVQANLLALEKDAANGQVYNVGTGRQTSVLDVAGALSRELQFDAPMQIEHRFRAGDIRHCFGDISKISKELGYAPRVGLEEGMRELLDWLREAEAVDHVDAATAELDRRGLAR